MNTDNLYEQICNIGNLILAWRRASKGKSRKKDVIEFEKDALGNLFKLQEELIKQAYKPKPLITFPIRDPKTRIISKSDFADRVIHHAICNIIEPDFDKSFIYDSCANRIRKGNLFALSRLYQFYRKITKNNTKIAFCLKADIKHYFEEVNHEILLGIIKRKITDEKVIWLIKQILNNLPETRSALDLAHYQKIISASQSRSPPPRTSWERNATWQFDKPVLC